MTARAKGVGAMLIASFALSVAVAAPASADDFRYWSSWTARDGKWTFASEGPGARTMVDGSVEGWRLLVGNLGARTPPRIEAASLFDEACASVAADTGTVRVAVAVDPGLPEDAPAGEQPGAVRAVCAVVPEGSNGYQALAGIAAVRVDAGFVCGIDGYPAAECAEPAQRAVLQAGSPQALQPAGVQPGVARPSARPASGQPQQSPLPTIAAVLAAALVAFAAWRVARSRAGAR